MSRISKLSENFGDEGVRSLFVDTVGRTDIKNCTFDDLGDGRFELNWNKELTIGYEFYSDQVTVNLYDVESNYESPDPYYLAEMLIVSPQEGVLLSDAEADEVGMEFVDAEKSLDNAEEVMKKWLTINNVSY